MDNQLSNELQLVQQSNYPLKYGFGVDDFENLSIKMNQAFSTPMEKVNKRISKLVKNRARMLALLDRRVSKLLNRRKK